MLKEKKLQDAVTLFAAIERKQHEALRYLAYKEKKSIAEITREAIDDYIRTKSKKHDLKAVS